LQQAKPLPNQVFSQFAPTPNAMGKARLTFEISPLIPADLHQKPFLKQKQGALLNPKLHSPKEQQPGEGTRPSQMKESFGSQDEPGLGSPKNGSNQQRFLTPKSDSNLAKPDRSTSSTE